MSAESPEDLNRRAAALRPELYPELEGEEFNTFVLRLVGEAGYELEGFPRGNGLRVGDRFAQTSCAALERLFMFDLWSKGVCYGNGKTADPRTMADAVGAFVIGRATLEEMEKRYPFIEFNSDARSHEAGRLVDERWRWHLEQHDDVGLLLMPLLRACANRPRLRALFPFTSHQYLLFSRTTGYPYDAMIARARPVFDPTTDATARHFVERFLPGLYELVCHPESPAERILGTGDAESTAAALDREVPQGWGGAVDGTKDD